MFGAVYFHAFSISTALRGGGKGGGGVVHIAGYIVYTAPYDVT